MAEISSALLRAAELIAKYAVTTQNPTPHPTTNETSIKEMRMGTLYDDWIRTTLRDAKEASNALTMAGSLLASQRSRDSTAHFNAMCAMATDRFERVMDYHNPYHPTSNPTGLVITREYFNPWDIRNLHRSVAMHMLAIHFARLEFLIIITHVDEIRLSTKLGRDFRYRLSEIMKGAHTVLNRPTQVQTEIKRTQASKVAVGLHHLEALMIHTEENDTSEEALKQIHAMRTTLYGLLETSMEARTTYDIMRNVETGELDQDQFSDYLEGIGITYTDQTGYEYDGNNNTLIKCTDTIIGLKELSITEEPRTPIKQCPEQVWFQIAGLLQEMVDDQTHAILHHRRIDATDHEDDDIQTNISRVMMQHLSSITASKLARFCSFRAVTLSIDSLLYTDQHTTHTESRFADICNLSRTAFIKSRLDLYGFAPSCYDDREYLYKHASKQTALTCRFSDVNTTGDASEKTPIWKRTLRPDHPMFTSLWAHTHSESAQMADIYLVLSGLVLCNQMHEKTHVYPTDAVAFLAEKILEVKFATMIDEGALTAIISKATEAFVDQRCDEATVRRLTPFDIERMQRVFPTCTQNPNLTESTPSINTPHGTMRPMPTELQDWIKKIQDISEELSPSENTDAHTIAHRPAVRPYILNCDPMHSTIREQSTTTRTHTGSSNHILTWDQSRKLQAAYLLQHRLHDQFTGAMLLSCGMRTNALMDHGIQAILGLMITDPYKPTRSVFNEAENLYVALGSDTTQARDTEALYGAHFFNPGYTDALNPESTTANHLGYLQRHLMRYIYSPLILGEKQQIQIRRPSKSMYDLIEDLKTLRMEWVARLTTRPMSFKFPRLWLPSKGEIDDMFWTQVNSTDIIDGIQITSMGKHKTAPTNKESNTHKALINLFYYSTMSLAHMTTDADRWNQIIVANPAEQTHYIDIHHAEYMVYTTTNPQEVLDKIYFPGRYAVPRTHGQGLSHNGIIDVRTSAMPHNISEQHHGQDTHHHSQQSNIVNTDAIIHNQFGSISNNGSGYDAQDAELDVENGMNGGVASGNASGNAGGVSGNAGGVSGNAGGVSGNAGGVSGNAGGASGYGRGASGSGRGASGMNRGWGSRGILGSSRVGRGIKVGGGTLGSRSSVRFSDPAHPPPTGSRSVTQNSRDTPHQRRTDPTQNNDTLSGNDQLLPMSPGPVDGHSTDTSPQPVISKSSHYSAFVTDSQGRRRIPLNVVQEILSANLDNMIAPIIKRHDARCATMRTDGSIPLYAEYAHRVRDDFFSNKSNVQEFLEDLVYGATRLSTDIIPDPVPISKICATTLHDNNISFDTRNIEDSQPWLFAFSLACLETIIAIARKKIRMTITNNIPDIKMDSVQGYLLYLANVAAAYERFQPLASRKKDMDFERSYFSQQPGARAAFNRECMNLKMICTGIDPTLRNPITRVDTTGLKADLSEKDIISTLKQFQEKNSAMDDASKLDFLLYLNRSQLHSADNTYLQLKFTYPPAIGGPTLSIGGPAATGSGEAASQASADHSSTARTAAAATAHPPATGRPAAADAATPHPPADGGSAAAAAATAHPPADGGSAAGGGA